MTATIDLLAEATLSTSQIQLLLALLASFAGPILFLIGRNIVSTRRYRNKLIAEAEENDVDVEELGRKQSTAPGWLAMALGSATVAGAALAWLLFLQGGVVSLEGGNLFVNKENQLDDALDQLAEDGDGWNQGVLDDEDDERPALEDQFGDNGLDGPVPPDNGDDATEPENPGAPNEPDAREAERARPDANRQRRRPPRQAPRPPEQPPENRAQGFGFGNGGNPVQPRRPVERRGDPGRRNNNNENQGVPVRPPNARGQVANQPDDDDDRSIAAPMQPRRQPNKGNRAPIRNWTSQDKSFRFEGRFVEMSNNIVVLESDSGTEVRFPFNDLSPNDQAWVRGNRGKFENRNRGNRMARGRGNTEARRSIPMDIDNPGALRVQPRGRTPRNSSPRIRGNEPRLRVFTSMDNRQRISAIFSHKSGGTVFLYNPYQKREYKIPFNRFSAEDQAWIRQQVKNSQQVSTIQKPISIIPLPALKKIPESAYESKFAATKREAKGVKGPALVVSHPDCPTLVSGDTIYQFSVAKEKFEKVVELSGDSPIALAVCPSGEQILGIISPPEGQQLVVWESKGGTIEHVLDENHQSRPEDTIAMFAHKRVFVGASSDSILQIYDTFAGTPIGHIAIPAAAASAQLIDLSLTGDILLFAQPKNNSLALFDTRTGKIETEFFLPSSFWLQPRRRNSSYKMVKGEGVEERTRLTRDLQFVSLSPNSDHILAVMQTGRTKMLFQWDRTGGLVKQFEYFPSQLKTESVHWFPGGKGWQVGNDIVDAQRGMVVACLLKTVDRQVQNKPSFLWPVGPGTLLEFNATNATSNNTQIRWDKIRIAQEDARLDDKVALGPATTGRFHFGPARPDTRPSQRPGKIPGRSFGQ